MLERLIHLFKSRWYCRGNCFTCPYYEEYCKEELNNA